MKHWVNTIIILGALSFINLQLVSQEDPSNSEKEDLFAEAQEYWNQASHSLEGVDAKTWVEKMDEIATQFAAKVDSLYEAYPQDPRIWNLVVQSGYSSPFFVTEIDPDITFENRWDKIKTDAEKAQAFKTRQEQRLRVMFETEDVPLRPLVGGYGWLFTQIESDFWKSNGSELSLNEYHDLLKMFIERLPENEFLTACADSYHAMLEQYDEAALPGFMEELKGLENPLINDWIAEKSSKDETAKSLASLSFKSLRGDSIDLSKMRGKVILIDFWATWCGPCKKEIPNVKSVYQDYHDKGFEIIGVSLDNASSEQKLRGFIDTNDMPWPQYFDGKAWGGDLVKKYGIKAIPAMYLLDQSGKIVSTRARGESLRTLVSELLDK